MNTAYIPVYLSLALVGDEWSALRPGRFSFRERAPGTHWIGGWMGPRTNLNDVEKRKICPYRDWNSDPSGHPPRNQSLYIPNTNKEGQVFQNYSFVLRTSVNIIFSTLHPYAQISWMHPLQRISWGSILVLNTIKGRRFHEHTSTVCSMDMSH
jgi:hypothetical protein